jgi:putative acetyltransferase
MQDFKIRLFRSKDAAQIARLFHETVREINIRDYSSSQVQAWAPDDFDFRNWVEVCLNRYVYVAEKDDIIVGFGELEKDGHIDCFYCHKDYQRCGVGRKIYDAIEKKGLELGLKSLFVEASITAKPFFQRMGFMVLKAQQVSRRGETFINYAMTKTLQN